LFIVGDGFDVALCDPVPFEIESDQPEWILEQARLHRLCDGFGFTEWRARSCGVERGSDSGSNPHHPWSPH